MAAEQQGLWDTVAQAAAKLWPGLAGALVALRWLLIPTTSEIAGPRFAAATNPPMAAKNRSVRVVSTGSHRSATNAPANPGQSFAAACATVSQMPCCSAAITHLPDRPCAPQRR